MVNRSLDHLDELEVTLANTLNMIPAARNPRDLELAGPPKGAGYGDMDSFLKDQLLARFVNHQETTVLTERTSRAQVDWNTIWDAPSFYNLSLTLTLVTPAALNLRNNWINKPNGAPEDIYEPLATA